MKIRTRNFSLDTREHYKTEVYLVISVAFEMILLISLCMFLF